MNTDQFDRLTGLDSETQIALFWLLGVEHNNDFLNGLKIQTQEWFNNPSNNELPLSIKQTEYLRISYERRKNQKPATSLAMELRLLRKEIAGLTKTLAERG